MTSPDAIIARLVALHPKKIDLSLDRMHRCLEALGHPERRLPPVIHVAGTNGKGSTVAFMRAIAEAAGLSVHVYTSPHLVRFAERFRLGGPGGGRLVDDERLADALVRTEQANAGAPITVFEITTAAGLLMFSETPADLLLLEVGLGGRLDATNVVDRPVASVITPVSMDHADYLGNTVAKIAAEKAGILKTGCPGIIAAQTPEGLKVIERQAARVRARLRIFGEDWTVSEENGRLVYQDEDGLLDLPAPRLVGRHQFGNAGTAIATLRSIDGLSLPVEAFERGLTRVEWPARLQRLEGRFAALAPPGSEVWLDGGHNEDGGRVIAAALGDFEERVPRPVVLIVGMLSTKDPAAFLGHFAGIATRVITVPIPGQEAAATPETVAAAAERVGLAAETAFSVPEALTRVAGLGLPVPPRILVTGSLYLAGHVLAENGLVPG